MVVDILMAHAMAYREPGVTRQPGLVIFIQFFVTRFIVFYFSYSLQSG